MKEQVDVIIATPGNMMEAEYVKSLVSTISFLHERKITFKFASQYSPRVDAAREATIMDSTFLDPFNNEPFLGELEYKKIIWIDSDISWEPSDFYALYSDEHQIISGVYLSNKGFPMFTPQDDNIDPRQLLNGTEPFPVMGVGFGFICMSRGVFELMPRPWFETRFSKITDAQSGKEILVPFGEDYSWCISAAQSGFTTYVNPLIRVTHNKKIPIKLN